MSKKYEILPPSRSGALARPERNEVVVSPPRVNPGGIIESTLTRWEANRHTRTISAIATRTRAETDLFEAQSQALNSYVKRQQAVYRVQELPEILSNDRERRRTERAEELRQIQHQHELADLRRMTEVAQVEAVLVDAQQALQAQRDHGYKSYELGWRKKQCEILDVELNAAERRAILRQHMAEFDDRKGADHAARNGSETAEDLLDALYESRAQLNANGLDTSRIDAAIERCKASR